MKLARTVVMLTALMLPSVMLSGQQSESPEQQLKAAMQRELVGGDLRAAIKEYEAIVSRHRDNRAVAARALVQIGLCYDKLGQPDARKVYEQVVKDYGDQAEPAAQARARLAAMSGQSPTAPLATAGAVRALPSIDTNDLQSVSPDGTKAAFIVYEKGQNLAVYDFATRQLRTLTHFDFATAVVYLSAWSPDSRQIAFVQNGFRPDSVAELRIITLATGEARTIFRHETNPLGQVLPVDWLPDGRTLLVTLQRADKTWVIGLIPAAGGPFTPLRSLQWTGQYPDRARVSPDGWFVAFADGPAGMRDIHLLSIDGKIATRLAEHPADDRGPLWAPDGRHIAWMSPRLGNDALWVAPIKDGQPAGEPVRVKDGLQGVNLIDWTPRGLVYVQQVRTSDIYTVSLDPATGQPGDRPQQLPYARTGRNTGPVWSPDGRHLAFISGSPAEPNRRYLVILPEKSGEPREFLIPTSRYSAGGMDPYDLRWFGDGSGLGFSGVDAQGERALFRLSLAGGQWKTSPAPAERVLRVDWDQTGSHYIYARGLDIVERDLETDQERVITPFSALLAAAARANALASSKALSAYRGLRISPDRRSLAFTSSTLDGEQSRAMLWVVDLQSGEPRILLEERAGMTLETSLTFGNPAWSPDSRALLVARTAGANRWPDLRVVSLDGSLIRSLVLDNAFARSRMGADDIGGAIDGVVWSADGTRLAFVLTASRRFETWIMETVVAIPASPTRAGR
jgi:Tol biopolymer transport system component